MGIISYSINHADHGLSEVACAVARAPGLPTRLRAIFPEVNGGLVLPTCNRVEIYLDLSEDVLADPAKQSQLLSQVVTELGLDTTSTAAPHPTLVPRVRLQEAAITHLFKVACGLDSMVVGEREISGQLRRAHTSAQNDKTLTPTLTRSIDNALRTSRRVAHLTGLASTGRSVVQVGLDLALPLVAASENTLAAANLRALIIGTGSYAGATVAALRSRNINQISVYSTSGRAAKFAEGHALEAVPVTQLAAALTQVDLVVTCRGQGSPVVTASEVAAILPHRKTELVILDLALPSDVEAAVDQLVGVSKVGLPEVQQAVPSAALAQVAQAEKIVSEGVAQLLHDLEVRRIDPVVVALRHSIEAALSGEIEKLPQSGSVTVAEATQALRRLAARLAHTPTVRARQAVTQGRAAEYVSAVQQVWGVEVENQVSASARNSLNEPLNEPLNELSEETIFEGVIENLSEFNPDQLGTSRCPVTGDSLQDLAAAAEPGATPSATRATPSATNETIWAKEIS